MNQVVTELVIDARGAEVGSASYVRYMQAAQQAIDRLRDREAALKQSTETNGAAMVATSVSTARTAAAYDRLRASMDPVFAAAKGLERDLVTLDRAVTRLGVSEAEASRMLDMIVLKHDQAAAAARRQTEEYKRLAAAGREAQALDQSSRAGQAMWNTYAGVRDPSAGARESAAVFSAELDRMDQVADLKAQQIGQSFAASLNTALISGTSKSARDAAAVFSAELDRMDEIARLRATEAGAAFTSDLNSRLRIGSAIPSARNSASVFLEADRDAEAYQQRLAMVRAEIDPLTAAIERQQAEVAELAAMYQRGDLSAEQFAQGQIVAAQRVEQVQAHLTHVGRSRQMGGNIMSGLNSAQQMQDILITAMMGQSIPTIALQQGTQLGSSVMMPGANGGPVGLAASLRSSLAALSNPLMLGAVGFTAITAAAIQFFTSSNKEAKTLNDLLKEQDKIVDSLGSGYEEMKRRRGDMFVPDESEGVANIRLRQNMKEAANVYQTELARGMRGMRMESSSAGWSLLDSIFDLPSSAFGRGMLQSGAITQQFAPFESIVKGLEDGNINIIQARREVEAIGRANPELAKTAEQFVKMTNAAATAYREMMGLRREIDRGQLIGPGAMGRAADAFGPQAALRRRMYPDEFEERNTAAEAVEMRRLRDELAAARLQMRARSPAELGAAARAAAEAATSSGESPEMRRQRIELAGTLAQETAENDLRRAQEQRKRSLEESISLAQQEVSMAGLNARQVDELRMRHQLLAEVRREAAENGIEADEKEIAAIRIKVAEMARLNAISAAREAIRDQREQIETLRVEAQMIGASADMRQRVIAMLQVEQDIRRRGIDLYGKEANELRQMAVAQVETAIQIQRGEAAWESWRSAGESAIDGLVDRLQEGDFEGALEGLGKDSLKTVLEMGVKNPLKNAAYGSGLPTFDDADGLFGLFARMFGGADKTAASALEAISGQTVGTMNVTAASVMISGGLGGIMPGVGPKAGNVTKLLSSANQNDPYVGSTIDFMRAGAAERRSPWSFLDLIGRAEGTDRGRGYNETLGYGAFTGGPRNLTGMTLDEIDALQRQMLAHPGNTFNSSALGRYQITGRTLRGLRGQMGLTGSELFDEGMQDRLAIQLAQGRGANVAGLRNEWEGLRSVDPAEIMRAYEGTADAVRKLGTVALPATDNLDLFGNGLGQIGQAIGKVPAGEGGVGGILGWLFKLLGGIPGFESGTAYAPGGLARINERGRGEIVDLPRGSRVIPHDVSMRMASNPMPAPTLNINSTIINNADVDVTRRQQDDGVGGVREEIIIERRVAAAISRPGSAANKELRAGGFQARRPRR